jgi:hypothetical protein
MPISSIFHLREEQLTHFATRDLEQGPGVQKEGLG